MTSFYSAKDYLFFSVNIYYLYWIFDVTIIIMMYAYKIQYVCMHLYILYTSPTFRSHFLQSNPPLLSSLRTWLYFFTIWSRYMTMRTCYVFIMARYCVSSYSFASQCSVFLLLFPVNGWVIPFSSSTSALRLHEHKERESVSVVVVAWQMSNFFLLQI